jgi:Zn2+/Cd2+-exporting ATPase
VSCCCEPESPYHRLLTVLSGVFLAVGLIVVYQTDGQSHDPLYVSLPHLGGALLLLSAALGGANFIPSGLRSLCSLSLDMDFLMSAALIAAAVIGEFAEAAAIGFLFSLAELAEDYAVDRSRSALDALISLEPDTAIRRLPDGEEVVPVEEIEPGDVISVRPGNRIPIDGEVVSGRSTIDEAPITGESMPVAKTVGDRVYAGTMNDEGYLEIAADRKVSETLLSRIVQMVEDAEDRKAPSEQFVRRFARTYTPVVILLALGVILLPTLVWGEPISVWFTRGLAVLVIACPCALIISTPVAVISAITAASRNGVLIKGGDHLEAIADIKVVAFDKTGTLTRGEFEVTEVVSRNGTSDDALLKIAGALESRSDHPIARSIGRRVDGLELPDVTLFESIAGLGVKGQIEGVDYQAGSAGLMTGDLATEANALIDGKSGTAVVVANDEEVLGVIVLSDRVRDEASACLASLRNERVRNVTMLTGDRQEIAEAVGREVGVDDVWAELLPGDKLAAIENLERQHGPVVMVGDGVNDAPALATARVGVAMGAAGSDAALETADAALMADDLSKMPYLFRLSRKARRVIRQNVFASIAIKLLLVVGAATGGVSLAAAIVVGDIGMSLAVTGNALRLARAK